MALSDEPTPAKPQTDKELEEQNKRETERQLFRRFFWDDLGPHGFTYQRIETDPDAVKDESPDVGQTNLSIALPKMMAEGDYNLYENDNSPKVPVNVDDKGSIALKNYPSSKNINNFIYVWRQYIRSYTLGLGSHRLDLDYPNCYKDGKPDSTKYMQINLENVMRILRVAESEKAAIYIEPDSALRKRLSSPKNKKEERLCQQILALANQTQNALAKDTELNKRQAENNHAANLKGLNKDINELTAKTNALRDAKEVNAKELEETIGSLAARFDQVNRDISAHGAPVNFCKQYETEIATIEKTLADTVALLEDEDFKNKLTDQNAKNDIKDIKDEFVELQDKAKELREKAGINALPSDKRAIEKTDDLRDKVKALEEAAKKVTLATQPDEIEKARDQLQKEMEKTESILRDIDVEINQKVNSTDELKKYQTAVTDAQQKIAAITLPNVEETMQLNQTVVNTATDAEQAILPTKEAEKNQLEKDIADLNALTDRDDKLEDINRYMNDIANRAEDLSKDSKKLEADLEKCQTPEEVEAIEKEFTDRLTALHNRQDAFESIHADLTKTETTTPQQTEQITKAETELKNADAKLKEFKQKMEAKKDEFRQSRGMQA